MGQLIDGRERGPGGFRRGLMLYGSTAALAAALMLAEGGIDPALAQEIGPRISPNVAAQGDFTVPGPTPSPSFEFRSGSLDIVSMNRDAVLNWTTYDAAAPGGAQGSSYVNFLPADTELRFVGNGQSFTAINRVFTTPDNAGNYRGIAFQGRVTSYLFGDGPNTVGPVGGNIWFFSPGGILATGSASFNVGSLLLSASDLEIFNETGSSREANFTGVADPFASVIVQPGARVTLTQPGSSFAIVAPTIEQGGDVIVNGSVLYISGETGYLSFSDSGSAYGSISRDAQAGNEVRHLGTTTGPASLSTDDFSIYDPQTIEFRTGQDVRILLSGSIGFAAATDAFLADNGSIVLTAGKVATTGDLSLTSTTFVETDEADFTAKAGDNLVMGGDANGAYFLDVSANLGTLSAEAGGVIDIAGDASFTALDGRATLRVGAAAGGGNTGGGRISVGGDLLLDSSLSEFGSSSPQGGDIEVTIGDGGSIAVGGDLTLRSDGYASGNDDGLTFATGGRAILAMTGTNANLTVGDQLTISAQARPSFQNCECFPPPSGSATGGHAEVTATGGTIAVGSLEVSASAEAFTSFYAEPGANLDATGGTARVSLGDSTASFSSIDVHADAQGANASQGADGGDALGGSASFSKGAGGTLATQEIVVTADASGGRGGNPNNDGAPATRGGDAEGGTASIALAQNAQGLGYLDLSAQALAGAGGDGTEYSAESGADGGDARGGTASLTLSSAGTDLTGVLEGGLDISASAGSGGDGEADYDNAVQAGDGGQGGSARGGSLTITAADGAEFAWGLNVGLGASAGAGGDGGNQIANDFGSSTIGQGGRGGDAMGATVSLVADGGLIAGDLNLDVQSFVGAGGRNGSDVEGGFTGSADFGLSTGGSIALIARDSSASRFEIGSASLNAGGDIAGLVAITDESTDTGASMRFGSLAAYVYGESQGPTPGFALSAVANAIAVDGTAEIYASSIALDFTGSGRLEVGGFAYLSTRSGDLTISHADNPGVLSLQASGGLEIYAEGSYLAGTGSVVASGDEASIRTTGSIVASDTRSLSDVLMSAQSDADVGDVSAGDDFELFAGRLDFDGNFGFTPSARAIVTGTVRAGGSVLVTSGGFAEFASGSQVLADNDITVRTGDDIIVAGGASLTSDINPDDFESLRLLAGDINFGPFNGDLIEPIGTPIASLRIAGSLDTNGASLFLSGDAIDASGSTITTGNLTLDVTDAPPFGPFSNDGGLLGDLCRQGSACLGSVTATGDVAIGLVSDNGLISLRTGAIDFSGDNFEIETLERIDLNPDNVPSSLVAGELISLRSVNDVVALTGVTLEAPTLELHAGTDLSAGTATLIGSDSVLIEVGNDLIAGTIFAGNGLDDGSDSGGPFTVPGDFIVGSLTYGGETDMRITAGGDVSLGFADPAGGVIDIRAVETLFLGSTAANSGAIRLDGESVAFNNLRSSGVVYATAGAGGISGLSEAARVIDTAVGIALETSGDVAVGDLFAGTDIAISGATVSIAALSAGGSLAVTAEGAGSVGTFTSDGYAVFSGASFELGNGSAGSFLAVQATEGDIGFGTVGAAGAGTLQASGALSGGDVSVGGELGLLGGSLAIGSAEGDAGISATIAGDAFFTSLASSGGAVALDAGGAARGGFATAAGAITIVGADVNLDFAEFGQGLVLDARTGFLTGSGLYQGAGATSLQAARGISIGSVDALGNIAMTAGAGAQFIELRSRDGSVNVSAGLEIGGSSVAATGSDPAGDDGVSLVAGRGILLDGAVSSLNPVSSAQDDFIAQAATTLSIVRAEAGRDLSLTAGAGTISAANVASGRDLSLTGPAVQLSDASVARNLTVHATGGDITGDGASSAGGTVDLEASGNIAIVSLAANGGDLTAEAGGSIGFADLSASGSLALSAEGAIGGGSVSADNFASIYAADAITLTGLSASNATLRSEGGAVSAGGVAVSGALDARGTAVTLAAPGALLVDARASAGDIAITTGGDLRVDATATGDIALASTGGSVIIGSVAQSEARPGGIGAEAVSGGGAVTVNAANAISVADGLAAGGALSMTAGGLVSLNGSATGQTIALTAADLAIGSAGTLGGAGTQRIALASTAPVYIGSGANTGFAIDAAEFTRIQSGGDLLVTALSGSEAGAGSLTVGNLTLNAGSGGQVGSAGTFGLTASGVLDVGGTLSIASAGSGNALMLTGDAVDLDYANAALSVLDSANATIGRIIVNGRLITSLSASAAADIVGKTPGEIDVRLGQADTVREIGLFRTANLTLEGRDAILIQNSGGAAVDERRGLSVGALTVTGAADGHTLVVINGIVNSATGIDAAQNVTVTTPIAAGSTVNGCALANIAGCLVIPEPESPLIEAPESVLFGTGDLIKDEEEDDEVEDGVADGKTEAPPIDTTRIDDPAGLPMIDDPVTGAGNEDLWQPPEP